MSESAERRPVVGYEGIYEVSSEGDVFSVIDRKGSWAGRKLKPGRCGSGYLQVNLCRDGVVKKHAVHRIVDQAFHPNPDNLPQTNHINGIKTDNRADNLEPSNPSLNGLHSYRVLGRVNGMKGKVGPWKGKPRAEGSGAPKRPVRGTNIKTGEVIEMESITSAARFVNGSNGYICEACQGKLKHAYGWRWEYRLE
jgi:hypothetical protein